MHKRFAASMKESLLDIQLVQPELVQLVQLVHLVLLVLLKQARVDAEAEKLQQQKQAQNLERQQALSRMRMDRGYYLDYCICKNEDVDQ